MINSKFLSFWNNFQMLKVFSKHISPFQREKGVSRGSANPSVKPFPLSFRYEKTPNSFGGSNEILWPVLLFIHIYLLLVIDIWYILSIKFMPINWGGLGNYNYTLTLPTFQEMFVKWREWSWTWRADDVFCLNEYGVS